MIPFILALLVGVSSQQESQTESTERAQQACRSSSECFSFEYCNRKNECVDASREPCRSMFDCTMGELCDLNRNPHQCS